MKKMMMIAALSFMAVTANASVLKICAMQATEICKELEGKDFNQCYWAQMDWCMEGPVKSFNNPLEGNTCEERCLTLPDSQVDLCMHECLHMI